MDFGEQTLGSLKMEELKVKGAYVLSPPCFDDNRGSFQELYNNGKYDFCCNRDWKQVNRSVSNKNVIRGIHRSPYSKLVSAVSGSIWDVVVDLRPESPTYLQWDARWLMSGGDQLFIPSYCGHGFYSPIDGTIVIYLQSGIFEPENEVNVHWQDPQLAIEWPKSQLISGDFGKGTYVEYVLSDKDKEASYWGPVKEKTHLESILEGLIDEFSPEERDRLNELMTEYAMDAIHDGTVRNETFINSAKLCAEKEKNA